MLPPSVLLNVRRVAPMRLTGSRMLATLACATFFTVGFVGRISAQPPASQFLPTSTTIQLPPGRPGDPPPIVTAMHLHPHGNLVVAAGDDHLIRMIDLSSLRVTHVMRGHADWVDTVAFSPDGRWLVTAGNDHRVVMWNVATAETRWSLKDAPGPVSRIQFSHDGHTLAVIGFGRPLQLLNPENGEPIQQWKCPCQDMRALAFSQDDNLLAAAGRNGRVRVWDLAENRELTTFVAHRQRVRDLTFGKTNDRLITAGEDRAVRVWKLPSAEEEFFLAAVPGKVLSLTLLPGDRIATACSDNVIRIWDLQSRRLISQLRGHQGSVATIDADAQRIVSAGFDATIRIWPMAAMDRAIADLQQSRQTQPVIDAIDLNDKTKPTASVPPSDLKGRPE